MYYNFGQYGRDWEEGVNFERLRRERLQKTREAMKKHGLGGVVAFTLENSRYITGIKGIETPGKLFRYTVLPIEGEPVHFELGGDLGRVKQNAPWMAGRLNFSIPISDGVIEASDKQRKKMLKLWADGIKKILEANGVSREKIGFDAFDLAMIEPLQDANINYVDATPTMYDARLVKTQDELQLLRIASRMADAAFYRMEEIMRPGIRECEIWAEVNRVILALGGELVLGICCSGGHTNPYFRLGDSDKLLAPGELLISDIVLRYMGYHTCVVRTFLVGNKPTSEQKALYKAAYDALYRTMNTCKAGVGTDKVAAALPEGTWENFSLNIGHGLGMHYHEPPFITSLYAKDYPVKLEPNMYIAIETYMGEPGGNQGVRLEEDFVITEEGYETFSKYPFDERML